MSAYLVISRDPILWRPSNEPGPTSLHPSVAGKCWDVGIMSAPKWADEGHGKMGKWNPGGIHIDRHVQNVIKYRTSFENQPFIIPLLNYDGLPKSDISTIADQ